MSENKSKEEITGRFIEAIDQLIARGKLKNYVEAAKAIKHSPQRISDIKHLRTNTNGVRISATMEMIVRLCEQFPELSTDYILLGRGTLFSSLLLSKQATLKQVQEHIEALKKLLEEL